MQQKTGLHSTSTIACAPYGSAHKRRFSANCASYISDGANRSQMERVLQAAGVPQDALHMVPTIVDTCRERDGLWTSLVSWQRCILHTRLAIP